MPRDRAGRLVQEELAVAGRRFRILVDGDDDRLDVLIAPAFSCGETTNFFERSEKRRRFFLVVEPSHQVAPTIRSIGTPETAPLPAPFALRVDRPTLTGSGGGDPFWHCRCGTPARDPLTRISRVRRGTLIHRKSDARDQGCCVRERSTPPGNEVAAAVTRSLPRLTSASNVRCW
jgi:hypothetical protein